MENKIPALIWVHLINLLFCRELNSSSKISKYWPLMAVCLIKCSFNQIQNHVLLYAENEYEVICSSSNNESVVTVTTFQNSCQQV